MLEGRIELAVTQQAHIEENVIRCTLKCTLFYKNLTTMY